MNRAVDRWFSQPVTQMHDRSNQLALDLARYSTANARAEANSIASSLMPLSANITVVPNPAKPRRRVLSVEKAAATRDSLSSHQRRQMIYDVLRQHEVTLQNGFAIGYRDGRPSVSDHMQQRDGDKAQVRSWVPDQGV